MPSAVVTGAGGGLGAAIASALATRGFVVYVTDLRLPAAQACANAIGPSATAVELDVTDDAACAHLAARVADDCGGLDVWVNNAGILATGPSWKQVAATRRSIFDVNAMGTMNGTLAALSVMQPRTRGHIINIISLAGIFPTPGEAVYSASKHAALAFSVATAADLRSARVRGVHISCVCPDGIWTPMLFGKVNDATAAASFSGSMLSVDQVVKAVESVLERPRMVLTIPRGRGVLAMLVSAFPGLLVQIAPMFLAVGRRRQRRFAKGLTTTPSKPLAPGLELRGRTATEDPRHQRGTISASGQSGQ